MEQTDLLRYAVETLEQRNLRHAERSHGPPHPPSPFVARSIVKPHLDFPPFQDLDFRRVVAAGDFSFLDRLGILKECATRSVNRTLEHAVF